jgi:hypothetical protein
VLAIYKVQIQRRVVYRYIAFAELALEWAGGQYPDCAGDPAELFRHAKTLILQGPRTFGRSLAAPVAGTPRLPLCSPCRRCRHEPTLASADQRSLADKKDKKSLAMRGRLC